MATPDAGIKKAIIQQADFPPLSQNGNYYIRYRVLTQDGVSSSAWSQVYSLTPDSVQTVISNKSQSVIPIYKSDGYVVTISWNIPSSVVNEDFDVFVNWSTTSDFSSGTTGWLYKGTTVSNNYQFQIPSTPTDYRHLPGTSAKYVRVWVQQAIKSSTSTPTTVASASLYDATSVSYTWDTANTLDGGTA